jgi:hypothetical protein
VPTISRSPVLRHFWEVVIRLLGGTRSPMKYALNCTIPALVNRSVGSSGTRESLGAIRCPLLSKNLRYLSLISLLCIDVYSPSRASTD